MRRRMRYWKKLKSDEAYIIEDEDGNLQASYRRKKRVEGRCYPNEEALLQEVEYSYRNEIHRMRRIIEDYHLLYQLKLKNGLTLEVCFMPVGIKGLYVRYVKVKRLIFKEGESRNRRRR